MSHVSIDAIERALGDHIASEILLRKTPLALDEDIFSAGFDSMSLERTLVFVEERFGVAIPSHEVDVDEIATVGKMARFVEGWLARAGQ